jgi:TonB family protein
MTQRATILLLALLALANADTLTLRNGTAVTGTWLGVASGQIKFQVNDQVQTYPRSDVSTVTFGDSAPPAPLQPIAPPPPPVGERVQEPDTIGAFYFRDPTGTLIPLQRIQATVRYRRIGLTKIGWYGETAGAECQVRLTSTRDMVFVVRLANGIDPDSYKLYPLEVDKGKRRTREYPADKSQILIHRFVVNAFGQSSYSLTPNGGLAPGEYAFSPRTPGYVFSPQTSNDWYCFGVDATPGKAAVAGDTRVALPEPSNDERPTLTRKSPPSPSDAAAPPHTDDVQEPTAVGVGGVSQPAVIQKVDPEYTEKARNAKLSGTVTLAIIVDADGQARDIHVVKALGMGLDEKAVESVKKWRFRPGMKDGKPVNVGATVEVNFLLASAKGVGVGLPNLSNDERPALTLAPPPAQPSAPPPTIELGQTKDQIVSIMGQPQRIANLGAKQIYFYKDLKITLTDGKVTDIQ